MRYLGLLVLFICAACTNISPGPQNNVSHINNNLIALESAENERMEFRRNLKPYFGMDGGVSCASDRLPEQEKAIEAIRKTFANFGDRMLASPLRFDFLIAQADSIKLRELRPIVDCAPSDGKVTEDEQIYWARQIEYRQKGLQSLEDNAAELLQKLP